MKGALFDAWRLVRDWHPAVIIALWITVLIGEWFALLVLPFSLASVVTIPLLLFTAAGREIAFDPLLWSAGGDGSAAPQVGRPRP